MATREQLAIALDSASGWTAVPMKSTGCYDTNHLFYAFHGVYTEFTQECVILCLPGVYTEYTRECVFCIQNTHSYTEYTYVYRIHIRIQNTRGMTNSGYTRGRSPS